MEKEITRVEKFKEYRKEIDESYSETNNIKALETSKKEKSIKQHTIYDEYKKQKNKKAALYVSISALFVLLLLVGLILFIVFKGNL